MWDRKLASFSLSRLPSSFSPSGYLSFHLSPFFLFHPNHFFSILSFVFRVPVSLIRNSNPFGVNKSAVSPPLAALRSLRNPVLSRASEFKNAKSLELVSEIRTNPREFLGSKWNLSKRHIELISRVLWIKSLHYCSILIHEDKMLQVIY